MFEIFIVRYWETIKKKKTPGFTTKPKTNKQTGSVRREKFSNGHVSVFPEQGKY